MSAEHGRGGGRRAEQARGGQDRGRRWRERAECKEGKTNQSSGQGSLTELRAAAAVVAYSRSRRRDCHSAATSLYL